MSAKACQGILNRAKRRGKDLPEILRIALEYRANVSTDGMCKANTFNLKTESQNVCLQEMQDMVAENPMLCNTQTQSVPSNEPVVLESNQNHATITDTGISNTLSASMGMGGGYVPMIAKVIQNESE